MMLISERVELDEEAWNRNDEFAMIRERTS